MAKSELERAADLVPQTGAGEREPAVDVGVGDGAERLQVGGQRDRGALLCARASNH